MEISADTINSIPFWLENKFHPSKVVTGPISGTYGDVYLMENGPNTFAVKTLKADVIKNAINRADLETMCREFRIWISLPPYQNVVPAFSVDLMTAPLGPSFRSVTVPLLRMSKMDGNLEDWTQSKNVIDEAGKLIALAQAFNGLHCLYQSGIEGHGDLKPSNILYVDITKKFDMSDRVVWPCSRYPWRVCISDLGWADAWKDLKLFNKTSREYAAPERLEDEPRFIAEKSDIFAMGLISAQLLLGKYPGNLKRAQKSSGDMLKIGKSGAWDLKEIRSKRIHDLIEACVSAVPESRPTALECVTAISQELESEHGQSICDTLAYWRDKPSRVQEAERLAWSAPRAARLSAAQAAAVSESLWDRIREVNVVDLDSAEEWAELAQGIFDVIDASSADLTSRINTLRQRARDFLAGVMSATDLNDRSNVLVRADQYEYIQPYERFASVVAALSYIGEVHHDQGLNVMSTYSASVRSALAYIEACSKKSEPLNRESCFELAIKLTPQQAALYYFRVHFAFQDYVVNAAISKSERPKVTPDILQSWKIDLDTAIRLSPDWPEPRRLLTAITEVPV
jgi:serine/threonine protein kinase